MKPTAAAWSQSTGTASPVIGVRTVTSRLTSSLFLVSATRTCGGPEEHRLVEERSAGGRGAAGGHELLRHVGRQ